MKKKILIVIGIVLMLSNVAMVDAKSSSSAVTSAIKLYKAGNYSECYTVLNNVIKKDPSNALAYYYLAITSAKVGKKDEAIENYDKALSLTPENSNINIYAQRGKACLESEESCKNSIDKTSTEYIIKHAKGNFSDKARSEYERLKLENLMRQMNRTPDVTPQNLREYKDFSSMNNSEMPSNDEIVDAMRILQRAGFANLSLNNELSLTGYDNSMNSYNNASLSPQMMQALFTGNMSLGF